MSFDEVEALDVQSVDSPAARRAVMKRKEAISTMETLVETEVDTAQRYELVLRLAHLVHEQARATRDPQTLAEAAELYARLLSIDPQNPQTDHVTFFLGFALQGITPDGGTPLLTHLVKTYPASKYVPHAYLHLGEAAFEHEDWTTSDPYFTQAADYGFPFRDFALYKLAWTARKLGDTDRAIETMRMAVGAARPGLGRVALQALTYWLEERGQSIEPALAAQVAEASRPKTCLDDVTALRARIAASPMAAEAVVLHVEIGRCFANTDRRALAGEAARIERMYSPGSPWWKLQGRAARKQARALVREVQASL